MFMVKLRTRVIHFVNDLCHTFVIKKMKYETWCNKDRHAFTENNSARMINFVALAIN